MFIWLAVRVLTWMTDLILKQKIYRSIHILLFDKSGGKYVPYNIECMKHECALLLHFELEPVMSFSDDGYELF